MRLMRAAASKMLSAHKHNVWLKIRIPFPKKAVWRVFRRVTDNLFIMCRSCGTRVRLAPLYIHSFRVIVPRSFEDKKSFNTKYRFYEDIDNVSARLKWCRMHMGLEQKDAAVRVGISVGQYSDMEIGKKDHIPKDTADKLSLLFRIPVTDLLNDYALFLYNGQGRTICEYRHGLGMGKRRLQGTSARTSAPCAHGRMKKSA